MDRLSNKVRQYEQERMKGNQKKAWMIFFFFWEAINFKLANCLFCWQYQDTKPILDTRRAPTVFRRCRKVSITQSQTVTSDKPFSPSSMWYIQLSPFLSTPNHLSAPLSLRFGAKDVKAIAAHVGSRNPTQVRTHAQKYYLRMDRERKRKEEREAKEREDRGSMDKSGDMGNLHFVLFVA